MCLALLKNKKETDEFINSIPAKEGIKVYRVITKEFIKNRWVYIPIFHYLELKEGVNKAQTKKTLYIFKECECEPECKCESDSECKCEDECKCERDSYKSGFHSFLNEEDARFYLKQTFCHDSAEVVECIVKKSWVTAFGQNALLFDSNVLFDTVISKKIFMPKLNF